MKQLIHQHLPQLTEIEADLCERYLALMQKWNRAYNLTAITEPEAQVLLHLADSLAIQPYLQGRRILDVGTGAGLPGIPLAICEPDREFHLLDSNGKKTAFLAQVKIELGLRNLHIHSARIEIFQDAQGFNTIMSRAFSELALFLELAGHLLAPQGRFLAMKGEISAKELAKVLPPFMIDEVVVLTVPGLDAHRQVVLMTKA